MLFSRSVDLKDEEEVRTLPYMSKTYSRIPEAQPQEYEYGIPPVELCNTTWIHTYVFKLNVFTKQANYE